jgi:hypothetical protein
MISQVPMVKERVEGKGAYAMALTSLKLSG